MLLFTLKNNAGIALAVALHDTYCVIAHFHCAAHYTKKNHSNTIYDGATKRFVLFCYNL